MHAILLAFLRLKSKAGAVVIPGLFVLPPALFQRLGVVCCLLRVGRRPKAVSALRRLAADAGVLPLAYDVTCRGPQGCISGK